MTLAKRCGNCIYWSANHVEHKMCKSCKELRNNFVPRDMLCPVPSCQATMIYYKKDAYLCCPDCGTEIWPFNSDVSNKATIREEFEKKLPCDRSNEVSFETTHIKAKKTGGSKSTKTQTKKSQQLKKPSTTRLYNTLSAASGMRLDKLP